MYNFSNQGPRTETVTFQKSIDLITKIIKHKLILNYLIQTHPIPFFTYEKPTKLFSLFPTQLCYLRSI